MMKSVKSLFTQRSIVLITLAGLLAISGLGLWLKAHPTSVATKRPLPKRFTARLAENEEQEHKRKTREDPKARQDWFSFQRSYPFDAPPAEGRRRAFESLKLRQPSDNSANSLEQQAGEATAQWVAIGPKPSRSLYFDENWGALSGRINAIAVSPTNANLVLIGASTGGIWRSTDAGKNFAPVSDSQVDLAVGSIAFARSNPNIVYAAMGDGQGFYLGSGVLKSTDAGQSWTRVSNDSLPTPGITLKIEVDPTNPNRLYLAQNLAFSDVGGLYLSTDGGVNWKRTLVDWISDVAISPVNSQIVYAGAGTPIQDGDAAAGLYRSMDGGETWKIIYAPSYGYVYDLRVAVTPADPQKIYAYLGGVNANGDFEVSFVTSKDSGATWVASGQDVIDSGQYGYNTYLVADPTNANTVYIGTRDVFRTDNAGASFTNLTLAYLNGDFNYDNSFSHPDQHALALSPASSNTIYIGNDGGLFKSENRGKSLNSLNNSLSLTQFVSLATHPTNPAITYGGTQDNGTQRRLNNSNEWQDFIGGDGGQVVINPANPSTVLTTIYFGLSVRADANGDQLPDLETTSPETFGEVFGGRIGFYPPFASNGVDNRLYFGSWRLFISRNFGDIWFTPGWTTDLTKGRASGDVLNAIAVSRSNPDVIYTGSAQGRAMVSTDSGSAWKDITLGLPNRTITSITVDPNNPATAYLTVSGYLSRHVFKTVNYGANWATLSNGLPDIPVNAFLFDPKVANTFYVGTDIGVFRSTNGGASWQVFNAGLPPVVVTALTSQASGLIQAGTYGRGAYQLNAAAEVAEINQP